MRGIVGRIYPEALSRLSLLFLVTRYWAQNAQRLAFYLVKSPLEVEELLSSLQVRKFILLCLWVLY